jgi:hypothetical protein
LYPSTAGAAALSNQPTFRTDLRYTREEQDGAVYYTIEDPRSQARFRLYEIEFHIARQFDGQRTLQQVAENIRREHDFEISDNDLRKFIGQLRTMHFVQGPEQPGEIEPLGLGPVPEPMGEIATTEMSLAELSPAGPPRSRKGNDSRRLLLTALTHLRQGELAHARDFVVAAQQAEPRRDNLDRLLDALDSLDGGATAEERANLWRQCAQWYPDIVAMLPPMHQPKRTTGLQPAVVGRRPMGTRLHDTFAGVQAAATWKKWLGGLLLLAACGGGGGAFYVLWNSAPQVHGRRLEAERLPIFSPQPASHKNCSQQLWASFAQGGRIAEIAEVGHRVAAHDVLVALALAPPQRLALGAAHAAVLQAEMQQTKLMQGLQPLQQQRQTLQTQQATALTQMQKLRPHKAAPDARARGQMAQIRRGVARTQGELARLGRTIRRMTAQLALVRSRLPALHRRQAELEARFGGVRRLAPFAGEVAEVRAKVGDAVRPNAPLVLLQDPSVLRLRFEVGRRTALKPDASVTVVAEGGAPLVGRVLAVSAAAGHQQGVDVELHDPSGALFRLPPAAFHLIESYADPAFRVVSRALVRGADPKTARVLLQLNGLATYRTVQVLTEADGEAVIFDASGKLHDRALILTAQADGTPLSALRDGTEVDLVSP